jgi:uncharacterized protein (DUF1684 family)
MNNRKLTFLMTALLAGLLLAGCGQKIDESAPGAVAMDTQEHDRWEIDLVNMRIEKNEHFSNPQQSPLPAERMAGFEGLEYYFPEPSLRFRTPFLAEAGTDTVLLDKRMGQAVPYVRRGAVRFLHGGQVHKLAVFGPAHPTAGDYLWLPFFDATSGKQTYAGGRYLDVEVDAEGMVDLDFNFAYNPLCDYNPDRFNCTLPPMENTLPFAVEAGEKTLNPGH